MNYDDLIEESVITTPMLTPNPTHLRPLKKVTMRIHTARSYHIRHYNLGPYISTVIWWKSSHYSSIYCEYVKWGTRSQVKINSIIVRCKFDHWIYSIHRHTVLVPTNVIVQNYNLHADLFPKYQTLWYGIALSLSYKSTQTKAFTVFTK